MGGPLTKIPQTNIAEFAAARGAHGIGPEIARFHDMLIPRLFTLFPALLGTLLLSLPSMPAACADNRLELSWDQVRDIAGEPLPASDADWKVVCFLGSECPLARLYGQRLNELQSDFAAQGVQVVGVNSNPQDSIADVEKYVKDLDVGFPIFKDFDQSWAREFSATRTPEVFVLDSNNQVRYQGRIDDQYEPGVARAVPTRHELRDALTALTEGQDPPTAQTKAVGCLITMIEAPRRPVSGGKQVTFTRDVAPVLNRHCVECHRPGEIGPFALTEYQEVVGWGEMILEVIEEQRMPPWHADRQFGEFVGARHLPDADQATLAEWVAQGMPEGDPADLPAQPRWAAGWQLPSAPDEEFLMRKRPFIVPAEGIVEYQYFVVDPKWEEERWVRAAQVAPGNASIVHHAIVFVRAPDGQQTDGIGWLGGYVPGQRTTPLPPGHARRLPAGSKLVFQMHYTPNGREASDLTKVGVWFADAEDVTHEVTTRVALDHDFEIPPGAENHSVEFRMSGFARQSRLLSVTPHMHLRGKSFRLMAQYAASDASQQSEARKTLLHVPRYDFNWQHWYHFKNPLEMDDVAALDMQVSFDNSDRNPANPDPRQFVTWGDQTFEEMAIAFFEVAHPRGEPRQWVHHASNRESADEAARQEKIAAEVDRFLRAMDQDGDGVIRRDEAPDAFRLFGFRQMDENDDDRIDRGEIENQAARRL